MKTQRYGNRAKKARIALEDGIILEGLSFGATGERYGEVVFNTSMAGYQEILTDPSYKGQSVTIKISLVLTSENGIIALMEGLCWEQCAGLAYLTGRMIHGDAGR